MEINKRLEPSRVPLLCHVMVGPMIQAIELGLDTFGDVTDGPNGFRCMSIFLKAECSRLVRCSA